MTTLLQELDEVLARGDIHEMHQFLRDEHEEIRAALELHAQLSNMRVSVPRWKLERAVAILERDGDEHGVATDIRDMLKAAPPAGGQDAN